MNKKNLLIGSLSLVAGATIYLLFRPETYIAQFIPQPPLFEKIRAAFSGAGWNFIKYYFADYLWGLSFCCFLHLIFHPSKKGSLLCAIGTFLYGTLLEGLQYFDIISGTADLWDILMFILASATALIINRKKEI